MINKLLSGAVKLYLRSQTEATKDLQVKIVGKNKQILQGCIPKVWLSCDRAVYQGLHLSQVELTGSNIAVNLPEVVKRKPLRLLESVFVAIQLRLDESDLQASLGSPLLQSGLADLWQMILTTQNTPELANLQIEWQTIAIAESQLNFTGTYQDASGESKLLTLVSEINLADAHTLCLTPTHISGINTSSHQQLKIDLGKDVAIEQLAIEPEQIICSGKIKVNQSVPNIDN